MAASEVVDITAVVKDPIVSSLGLDETVGVDWQNDPYRPFPLPRILWVPSGHAVRHSPACKSLKSEHRVHTCPLRERPDIVNGQM